MDKALFHSLLAGGTSAEDVSLSELTELLQEHPYFQAGHAIAAQKARHAGHDHQALLLQKALIYAPSRKVVQQFVKTVSQSPVIHAKAVSSTAALPGLHEALTFNEAADENVLAENVEQELGKSYFETDALEDAQFDENLTLHTEQVEADFLEAAPELLLEEETLAVQTAETEETIQEPEREEYVSYDVAPEMTLTALPELADIPVDDELTKMIEEMHARQAEAMRALDQFENTNNSNNSSVVGQEDDAADQPPFFRVDEKTVLEEEEKKNAEPNVTHTSSRVRFIAKWNAVNKERQENIIQHFVDTNPYIDLLKGDDGNDTNTDLTSDSLSRVQTPDTESMALLLAKQGKKAKAIEVYKRLQLKYPEKNAYFAAQIVALKEL